MSKLTALLFLLLCCFYSIAQSVKPGYDKRLADSLGADEYGMKSYVFVILKTGSGTAPDKKAQDSLFNGHMQNIIRMANEGKLVLAGPFFANDKKYEGIFVLNVKTTDEAKALLDTDPAIKAKLLDPELYSWYGSAALPMFLDYHKKIQKTSF